MKWKFSISQVFFYHQVDWLRKSFLAPKMEKLEDKYKSLFRNFEDAMEKLFQERKQLEVEKQAWMEETKKLQKMQINSDGYIPNFF